MYLTNRVFPLSFAAVIAFSILAYAQAPVKPVQILNPAYQEGKWGYVDSEGKLRILYQYDLAGRFRSSLAPVQIGEKFVYIDVNGKTVIDRDFDWADEFSEGLGLVSIRLRCGFVQPDGTMKIEPHYEWAGSFHQKRALVRIEGKYGYIAPNGELIIPAKYVWADDFREGLASVSLDGESYGFIDLTGREVIDRRFLGAAPFHEGISCVRVGQNRVGYINREGQQLGGMEFLAGGNFLNGIAAVKTGEKWAVINKNSDLLCASEFDGTEIGPKAVTGWKMGQKFSAAIGNQAPLDFRENHELPPGDAWVQFVTNMPPATIYKPTLWEYRRAKKRGSLKPLQIPELRLGAGDANTVGSLSKQQVYMILFVKGQLVQERQCKPGADPVITGNF